MKKLNIQEKASNESMILQGPDPKVSTFPIMAMGSRQCLSLSVVQLKCKSCQFLIAVIEL